MKFQTKYRLCLWKSYLDTGLGWTNYLKYVIAFFGLASNDVRATMTIAFYYAVFCFILGWALFRYGWVKANIEVSNKYNLFVRQVRRKI